MTDEDSDPGDGAAPPTGQLPISGAWRSGRLLLAQVGEQLVDLEHIQENVA
jgi:hypothetical protein